MEHLFIAAPPSPGAAPTKLGVACFEQERIDRRDSVASITSTIGGDTSPPSTPNVSRSCPNAYHLGAEPSESPPRGPLIDSQACELAEEEAERALLEAVSRKNKSLNLHMRAALACT